MDKFPSIPKKVDVLRNLSIFYGRDLCNYNNYLIESKQNLYYSDYRNITMYRGLELNYQQVYEEFLKKQKENFIQQFLVEFKHFNNSFGVLKTISDFRYEVYKLNLLKKSIHSFYLSNSDVGGLSLECLSLLDDKLTRLSKKIKESHLIYEGNQEFNNFLNNTHQIENSSLDRNEIKMFSLEQLDKEFEINNYW